MNLLQRGLIALALASLFLGLIGIRAEMLVEGQILVNIGLASLIAILLIQLFKEEDDDE